MSPAAAGTHPQAIRNNAVSRYIDICAQGNRVGAMTKEMHHRIAKRAYRGIRLIDPPYSLGHIEVDAPSFIESAKMLCGDSSCGDLEH